MKRSQCRTCHERFEGSTSHIIKQLQKEHYDAEGHRFYQGVIGFGDFTFPPHPAHPDVDLTPQPKWAPPPPQPPRKEGPEGEPMTSKPTTLTHGPATITRDELQAELRSYIHAGELAAWKRDVATLEHLQSLEERLEAIVRNQPEPQVGGGLTDKEKASMERAFAQLKQMVEGVVQKSNNQRQVLDRFKKLEKEGFPAKIPAGVRGLPDEVDGQGKKLKAIEKKLDALQVDLEGVDGHHSKSAAGLRVMVEVLDQKLSDLLQDLRHWVKPQGFIFDAKKENTFEVTGYIGPAKKGDWVVSVGHGGAYQAGQVNKATDQPRIHLRPTVGVPDA